MSLGVLAKATRTVTAHMKEIRVKPAKAADKYIGKTDRSDHHGQGTADPCCIIYDPATDTTYLRGKLLGKGGFAKCYELTDLSTNKLYAGKIINKNRISKPHQRQKIIREVELHRNLKNKHVVEFHNFFEDEDNVYIVLELCIRKSLVHVLKQRKTLTEPEVRYYIRQLTEGVQYTHNNRIIHRDLKLGNMLINDSMELKIADFGLATRVDYDGEKKMTVCGTPNYIAPEVLQKRGHSFEADIWAIGCIMFALLIGKPPFETSSLKETYVRISANSYFLPPGLSPSAKNLIRKCLSPDPEKRPTLDQILKEEFMTHGYLPKILSTACCTSMPKFPSNCNVNSRPLSYAVPSTQHEALSNIATSLNQMKINSKVSQTEAYEEDREILLRDRPMKLSPVRCEAESHGDGELSPVLRTTARDSLGDLLHSDGSTTPSSRDSSPRPGSAASLLDLLTTCIDHMPKDVDFNPRQIPDAGFLWITKWVDYSNKYGFGFQLSNRAIGVLFNDTSRITLGPDGRAVQYYDISGRLSAYTSECIPAELQKKTTLLQYFAQYMDEHLIQGGNMDGLSDSDETWCGGLYLKKWFRTPKAIVLYLSDGTLQVNFFDDHTKIILSRSRTPDNLVTYIDEDRRAGTYGMFNLIIEGCRPEIRERMCFARTMLQNLVDIEGEEI